jgi:hypothetical protein
VVGFLGGPPDPQNQTVLVFDQERLVGVVEPEDLARYLRRRSTLGAPRAMAPPVPPPPAPPRPDLPPAV